MFGLKQPNMHQIQILINLQFVHLIFNLISLFSPYTLEGTIGMEHEPLQRCSHKVYMVIVS